MNRRYIIKPCVSAGEIALGMKRDKVRELLGAYSEYKNRKEDSNTVDCFDICQVFYNKNNCAEFIMFHELDKTELELEDAILNKMSKEELISFMRKMDSDIVFDSDMERIESNNFGVACYFVRTICFDEFGKGFELNRVETISVAIKDYWKQSG